MCKWSAPPFLASLSLSTAATEVARVAVEPQAALAQRVLPLNGAGLQTRLFSRCMWRRCTCRRPRAWRPRC